VGDRPRPPRRCRQPGHSPASSRSCSTAGSPRASSTPTGHTSRAKVAARVLVDAPVRPADEHDSRRPRDAGLSREIRRRRGTPCGKPSRSEVSLGYSKDLAADSR
jgi:hypothetical protein